MWETEEEKKRTPGKFGDGERTCFHCGVFLLRGIFFSFFSSLAVIWRRVSEGREEEGSFALSSIFLFPFTPFPFAFAFALGSQGRLVMVVVASLRDGRDTETGKRILRWVMRERDMAFARIPGCIHHCRFVFCLSTVQHPMSIYPWTFFFLPSPAFYSCSGSL